MLRKLLNFTLFAVAAALLAAVGYWNISPESFSDRPARAGTDNAIDFYVIGANTLQYQADGKLHYEMTTSKLEHIKATDITLLSEPNLHLYRGTQYPWKVRSVRGEVAPEGKEVELIDQVRERPGPPVPGSGSPRGRRTR